MRGGEPNYLKLMLAIAGGVVLGGIALWIASILLGIGLISAVASGMNFSLGDPPSSSVTSGAAYKRQVAKEKAQEAANERRGPIHYERAPGTSAMRQTREQSELGRKYWAECDEWARNYKMTPTETTRLNGKFYCDRYSRFIETGRSSTDKPPF